MRSIADSSLDTVLPHKAVHDVEDPLGVDEALELPQHVVVPDELAAGRGQGAGVPPHLALEREGYVIGVTGEREGGREGGRGGGREGEKEVDREGKREKKREGDEIFSQALRTILPEVEVTGQVHILEDFQVPEVHE